MPNATAIDPARTTPTRPPSELAVAAREDFLGWYEGNTRGAYDTAIQILFGWCAERQLDPLEVTRSQLEAFVKYLQGERGNSLSTIKRRMSVVRGFYRIAAADRRIDVSPADSVRLPRGYPADPPDNGLTRYEVAAMMRAASTGRPAEAALLALLGWLGLRVTEACTLRIADMNHLEDGHCVLRFIGKGQKPARVPIPVPVLRFLEAAAGDRAPGEALLIRRDGQPYNRRGAARTVARLAKAAGIDRPVTPHWLRHGYVSNALDAGIPLVDVSLGARHADTRMTQRYDRRVRSFDGHANYALAVFMAGVR